MPDAEIHRGRSQTKALLSTLMEFELGVMAWGCVLAHQSGSLPNLVLLGVYGGIIA